MSSFRFLLVGKIFSITCHWESVKYSKCVDIAYDFGESASYALTPVFGFLKSQTCSKVKVGRVWWQKDEMNPKERCKFFDKVTVLIPGIVQHHIDWQRLVVLGQFFQHRCNGFRIDPDGVEFDVNFEVPGRWRTVDLEWKTMPCSKPPCIRGGAMRFACQWGSELEVRRGIGGGVVGFGVQSDIKNPEPSITEESGFFWALYPSPDHTTTYFFA